VQAAAAASGCGCAPDSWVRWVVFGVLVAGGIAIWLAGRRRARRGAADPARIDPASPDGGGAGRGWTERGPSAAAAVMIVLAGVVAIVQADADVSLAALVIGAIVASVGMGVRVGGRASRSSVESPEDR
jgi:hypothetical protein